MVCIGGALNTIKRTVAFWCPGDAIPAFVEVDLSNLNVGDKILLHDLQVDSRLRLVQKNPALPVCKIMGSRASALDGADS